MKKLEKENKKATWVKNVKCEKCGESYEINSSDVTKKRTVVFDGTVDVYGFICPECKSFTRIEREQIPAVIQNNAKVVIDEEKEEREAFKRKILNIFRIHR